MHLLTLPNLLTGLRFILVPLFVIASMSPNLVWQFAGTVLFSLAAWTDHWDGKIARRRRQVTQFGKFADPLADKLLTLTGFTAIIWREEFVHIFGYLLVWVVIIAVREIGITALRIWAISKGTALITSIWGKAKTTVQLFTIIFTLVFLNFRQLVRVVPQSASYYPGDNALVCVVHTLIFVSMIITVISGILYLSSNRFELRKIGQIS